MSSVKEITSEDFQQQVLTSKGKVLVDFYAPWCGPCKMIAPVLEQVANENSALTVIKVNADEAPDLMAQYGVRGIPTLLLLNDGELVDRKVGAASVQQVTEFVDG
ncbi:thioredoxin [Thalassotalea sp. 1_MG-2023]|uniref:thioredoxin n=1 Tax=Thalassotalea sp. 1_MG-2023 TaxID=3062680 RepID=UPI0026E3FB65|nr:thioredoxin [Thalassotalea sp. 1_MG-2023]MDO6426347.1 thioredoxin [Thalassotalea sp. 1_MG-2023]